jgi:hypothetical protein
LSAHGQQLSIVPEHLARPEHTKRLRYAKDPNQTRNPEEKEEHLPSSASSSVSTTAAATSPIPRATSTARPATCTVRILLFVLAHGRGPALKLDAEPFKTLAHIRISHVHLSEEVICQSSVIIESTQVCAAHVADLELLMT